MADFDCSSFSEICRSENNTRFESIKEDIHELKSEMKEDITEVKKSLQDLQTFKVEMMTSSKWIAILVSSGIGVLSLFTTGLISYWVALKTTR